MKKKILILTIMFLFISCNENTIDISDSTGSINIDVSDFKYALTNNHNNDTIYTFTYDFDGDGKLISETYFNYFNQNNYFSQFLYDNIGRLTDEYRDGKLFTKILYINDILEIYRYSDTNSFKIAEIKYENKNLVRFTYGFENNNTYTLSFDFDSEGDVILKRTEEKTLEEYLEYNKKLINPFFRLKSIEALFILRNYIPISKYVYKTNQVYPTVGDDYSTSMQYYDLYYETDENFRIIKITGGQSLIYAELFKYDLK
jgi:hypothetical protein